MAHSRICHCWLFQPNLITHISSKSSPMPAISPARAAKWLHMHGPTFTLKFYSKLLAFMSGVHAWLATWSNPVNLRYIKFRPPVSDLPSSVEAQISATQALVVFASGPVAFYWPHMVHVDLPEIFECAHLKFMVSGRSKQASIARYTHTCAMQSH